MLKVIISPCYGPFEPTPALQELCDKLGVALFSLEMRTHPEIIAFVEQHLDPENNVMIGAEYYMYIRVVEVDTSRPWYIDRYDGSEGISYVEYEMVNPELNFVRML